MRAVVIAAFAVLMLLTPAAFVPPPVSRLAQQDDGRIGTVLDRHGLAFVQPSGRSRWTPLGKRTPLLAGDSVRTDLRGANAIEIELAGGGTLLLGPDARAELGMRRVHLLRGECEIDPGAAPVAVTGPGGFESAIATRSVLRATTAKTETLSADPRWLAGYRSSTTSEWMGSLVAKIDGRDVPLAIRDHEVAVTIKDGVAETTLEQTYANATDSELEGVFTFPLPPGASVSGFAMWVGRELVEADIVERARARAIYEDLKRRKVDPGLLEWSGGNLFTARVWPIPRHGEKRIRIRYTQLLPLEGASYTWSTALRSAALRSQPVRSVRVRAEVASTRELVKVASTTHEVTAKASARSATVEWDAKEFTPDRDFELRIEIGSTAPLSIVDHVRDGEGYFVARVVPPGPDGEWQRGWQRTALPDGKAVDVVVVCDTSGSMDSAARAAQEEVVAALLGSLGEGDRFRLLASDWQAQWFDPALLPVSAERTAAALEFLRKRPSLGWTDLDLALRTALEVAEKGALIVYVGDGMVTRGDADGRAFARRAESMLRGRDVTLHAVAVSNAIDATVLDAITLAGHGSHVVAGDEPGLAVASLLNDALAPRLEDARISIDGIEVARVYPARLPNVPVGRERIVVGRYRHTGAPQSGKVTVEGRLAGRPVSWTRDCTLGAGDPLHSYVPRLWAVRHIDALLDEGQSPAARADVVAHSIEYQVMTPLTSLLVLETDADRERYGVTRRVKIRDGEAFFAQASDTAKADRLREAMQDAARWRVSLRQAALREIAGLGRDAATAQVAWGEQWDAGVFTRTAGFAGGKGGSRRGLALDQDDASDFRLGLREEAKSLVNAPAAASAPMERDLAEGGELPPSEPMGEDFLVGGLEAADESARFDDSREVAGRLRKSVARRPSRTLEPEDATPLFGRDRRPGSLAVFGFPALGRAIEEAPLPPDPAWPADVIAALRALDRTAALRALDGVELSTEQTSHHALTQRIVAQSSVTLFWNGATWFSRSESNSETQPSAAWLVDGRRGAAELALMVGRERPAAAGEALQFRPWLPGQATADLPRAYRLASLVVESQSAERLVVVLRSPGQGEYATRLVVDLRRNLVERGESLHGTKVTSSWQLEETLTIADLVMPSRVVHRDDHDRIVLVETLRAERLEPPVFATRIGGQIEAMGRVLFADAEDPELESSREALHAGAASPTQALAVLADLVARGRADALRTVWPRVRPMLADRPTWIELDVAQHLRRGETLLELARDLADSLAAREPGPSTYFLARHLRNALNNRFGANERFDLHQRIRPALGLERDDALAVERAIQWRREEAQHYGQIGDTYRHHERIKLLAQEAPWNLGLQTEAAQVWFEEGARDRARTLIENALARSDAWTDSERDQLWNELCNQDWSARDVVALQRDAEGWLAAGTNSAAPWSLRWSAMLFQGSIDAAVTDVVATAELALDLVHDPRASARVQAAVGFLLGEGHGFSRHAVLEEDLPSLDRLARKLIATKEGWPHAWRIVADDRFRRTDIGRTLVGELVGRLANEPHVLGMPYETLESTLRLVVARELSDDAWPALANSLEKRIAASEDSFQRDQLLMRLLGLCDARDDAPRALDALRTRLNDPRDAESVPSRAHELLSRLARRPWSEAVEDELLAIALRTVDPRQIALEQQRRFTGVARELADALLELRRDHALGPVAELEKFERAERRRRELAATETARRACIGSLHGLATRAPALLQIYLQVEELGFAAELGEGRENVRETAIGLLDALIARGDEAPVALARRRTAMVLAYLATKRGAEPALVDGVLATLRERDAKALDPDFDWRGEFARLLVALDRTDTLVGALGEWIVPSRIDAAWRTLRAWSLASRGDFAGARTDLDRVASDDELDARAWLALATWRLIGGDERGWLDGQARRFEAMDEWSLRNLVSGEAGRIRAKAGEKLDPVIVIAARAMLAKTSNARWMLQSVRELWDATKDHRLLGTLSGAVIGHTPEHAYAGLSSLREFLTAVHEEAALDELASTLSAAGGELSPTDRRALTFATYLVRARASLVPNGKGEHRAAMIAALRSAAADLDRALAPGERIAMARMLADLDALPGDDERALRRQMLETLRAGAASASLEDLAVSQALGQALWSDGAQDAALDVLLAALQRSERDAGGALPSQAHTYVETVVSWWTQRGRFAEAERRLIAWRDPQPTPLGRERFDQRLDNLYIAALDGRGTTGLGSGRALFDAARARMAERIATSPAGKQWTGPLLHKFADLHRSAWRMKTGEPVRSLTEFASTGLVAAMERNPVDATDHLYAIADALADVGAARDALALFVEHCLHPQAWFARTGHDPWNRFDWRIAELRTKAGALGKLHGDLRALVLRELERDLVVQGNNVSPMWQRNDHRYWSELHDDFVAVANKVLELRAGDRSAVAYTANLLWNHLGERRPAVRAMESLAKLDRIDVEQRRTLVDWLLELKEFAQAVPHAQRLVADAPLASRHHGQLVHALGALGRRDEARAALVAAAKRFDEARLRTDDIDMGFAMAAEGAGLDAEAVAYMELAVRARERNFPAGRESLLTQYLRMYSRMLGKVGRHDESIEASGAAFVRGNGSQQENRELMTELKNALGRQSDLAAWITRWDARVAAEGVDAPLIRKALAQVLDEDGEKAGAVAQYRAAIALSPNDVELHAALVAVLDALGKGDEALAASFDALRAAPGSIPLIESLAERLARSKQVDAAERAWSDLVEHAPQEGEGHAALARQRERAGRLPEAIEQWQQAVRTRADDAEGYLSLAAAQLRAGQRDEANATISIVLSRNWLQADEDVKRRANALMR